MKVVLTSWSPKKLLGFAEVHGPCFASHCAISMLFVLPKLLEQQEMPGFLCYFTTLYPLASNQQINCILPDQWVGCQSHLSNIFPVL